MTENIHDLLKTIKWQTIYKSLLDLYKIENIVYYKGIYYYVLG